MLYECKADECGGKPTGNSLDGGSRMGMAMYLRGGDRVNDKPWSVERCASFVKLTDVRYLVAELPGSSAHVSAPTGP